MFNEKKLFITGGTGSIGNSIFTILIITGVLIFMHLLQI